LGAFFGEVSIRDLYRALVQEEKPTREPRDLRFGGKPREVEQPQGRPSHMYHYRILVQSGLSTSVGTLRFGPNRARVGVSTEGCDGHPERKTRGAAHCRGMSSTRLKTRSSNPCKDWSRLAHIPQLDHSSKPPSATPTASFSIGRTGQPGLAGSGVSCLLDLPHWH